MSRVVDRRGDAHGAIVVRLAGAGAIVLQGAPGYALGDVAEDVIAVTDADACEWLGRALLDAAAMLRDVCGDLAVAGAPLLLPTGSTP